MCVKCILLTLYVNRLSGMCSLRFCAWRKSVGTRHVFFLPDGCDADDCCILFFFIIGCSKSADIVKFSDVIYIFAGRLRTFLIMQAAPGKMRASSCCGLKAAMMT